MARKKTSRFLLCVNNSGYPASLEIRKVYQTMPGAKAAELNFVRIVDESGEDYLYPESCFVQIDVPQAARAAFARASLGRIPSSA